MPEITEFCLPFLYLLRPHVCFFLFSFSFHFFPSLPPSSLSSFYFMCVHEFDTLHSSPLKNALSFQPLPGFLRGWHVAAASKQAPLAKLWETKEQETLLWRNSPISRLSPGFWSGALTQHPLETSWPPSTLSLFTPTKPFSEVWDGSGTILRIGYGMW